MEKAVEDAGLDSSSFVMQVTSAVKRFCFINYIIGVVGQI